MYKLVKWMNQSRAVAWIYLFIGLGGTYLGTTFTLSTLDFLNSSIPARGVVTELSLYDGSYYPTINFIDSNGHEQTFKSNYGCKTACYSVKDGIEILYQVDSESKPKIDSFTPLWGGSIVTLGIGVSFILVSIRKIFQLNKESKQRAT